MQNSFTNEDPLKITLGNIPFWKIFFPLISRAHSVMEMPDVVYVYWILLIEDICTVSIALILISCAIFLFVFVVMSSVLVLIRPLKFVEAVCKTDMAEWALPELSPTIMISIADANLGEANSGR